MGRGSLPGQPFEAEYWTGDNIPGNAELVTITLGDTDDDDHFGLYEFGDDASLGCVHINKRSQRTMH